MSYTPGNWKAQPILAGWVDIYTDGKPQYQHLPFISCKHFHQEDNANLICAAPDLLKALEMMLDAFHEDPLEANTTHAIAAAYAAIAKAKGEQE